MTIESQVSGLIDATTALTATVNNELTKVRAENTAFKATVISAVPSASNNSIVVLNGTSGSFLKKAGASGNGVRVDDYGGAIFDGVYIGLGTRYRHGSNCVVGFGLTFENLTTGTGNSVFGYQSLVENTSGNSNTAIGRRTLLYNTTGSWNTGIGDSSLYSNTTGNSNTGIGQASLYSNTTGNNNSALGFGALRDTNYNNCVGLGAESRVTGDNQLQLGTSGVTSYAYGAVQNRSDERDKADIRPTILGLEFIKALRPVDFRWDMRDDYRTPLPTYIAPDINASEEEKRVYESAYAESMRKWQEANKLSNLAHNGSKKRKRFHHGIIAQDVDALIRATGVDFGGFQNHRIAGGDDVLSVGYPEFIAPLIKAVQELSDMNDALKERVKALEAKVA